MKFIKYLIIYLIVLVIETNFIDIISINGITPDIILILLVFISLKESQSTSTVIGFSAGLLQDVFTMGLIGLSSLTKSISCFLTSFFQHSKRGYSIYNLMIIFFLISVIHDRIYQFIFLLGTNQVLFKSFFYYTIPRAIYTVVFALIINFLLHRIIWQSREI